MTITTNAATKVAAVATGLTMVVSLLGAAPLAHAAALTSSQISAIVSLLQSFGADSTTIANVQASLTGGAPISGPGSSGGSSSCGFSRDLTIGASGADVTCLQNALIAAGYSISAGATGYFGAQTQAAVSKWQKAAGVSPTAGYFGAKSRAVFTGGGSSNPGNPGGPITGNGLKVMLASDSPNGTALVQGQAAGTLGKFTFQNPTGSAIVVTNLAFKRTGVSNDSTMTNVYLYNGATRLTDSAGVSVGAFSFNNPVGLFTVPAGGWTTVTVASDIAAGTAGQQIGVQLNSVAASGALDSSVSLPIMGGLQSVSAATLANADLATATLPSSTANVDPQADYVVWQNTVTVGTRAVFFKSFALRQIGSAQVGDVINYRLYVDGVKVGNSVATRDGNDMISFDLSGSPVRLETGGRVIKVIADVVGGASRTFSLSLRYPGDALYVDTDLGQPVLVRGSASSITGTFTAHTTAVQTINSVSTAAPSVSRSADSPTANVSLGASNVKWASFKIIANGEAIKIDNIDVSVGTSTPGGAAANPGLDNGKVFLNGVQVGSTKDIVAYGGSTTNFTFGSSFIVPIGQTAVVDIYADAKAADSSALTSGTTVKIYLGVGSSNGQGQVSFSSVNVPASELTGNTITVSSSALTASKASYYGNQTVIAGATQAKVGAFTLSTGATEGINVNTIEIGYTNAKSSTLTNLMLKDHDTGAQFGSTKSTVSTTNSFTGNINIPASGTKTYDVYADVKTNANIGPMSDESVTTNTTGTGLITGTSVAVGSAPTLQTITVGSATLTVTDNTGATPVNANIIAGTTNVKVGTFRFTTQYSPYTVDQVAVIVPSGPSTSIANVTVKYLDSGGVLRESSQTLTLPATTQPYATATFTGLTFYVPADSNRDLTVYVNTPTIQSGATSGSGITAGLAKLNGFNATDSAGNADTSLASTDLLSNDTSGYGTLYVRKTIPTIGGTGVSSALAAGADQVLGRFTVTADAAGDVDWGQISFLITKTTSVNIGATSTVKVWDVTGAQQNIGGTFATTTGALLGGLDAIPAGSATTLYFRPTTVQTVSAGSTRTYELRGTIADSASSGTSNVTVQIANAQTSATTTSFFGAVVGTLAAASNPSFAWSDWSDPTDHATSATANNATDWITDYLVNTLSFTAGNRSAAH